MEKLWIIDLCLNAKRLIYNYFNSANMGLEAQHVRECLLKGLTESPLVQHEDSLKFPKHQFGIFKNSSVNSKQIMKFC